MFLPAVVPAIVTVALFAFITSWNELLGSLVMNSRESAFTLPVILAAARTETSLGGTDWGMLQAGITISIIPCILVYVLLQKYYVSGLAERGGQVMGDSARREHRSATARGVVRDRQPAPVRRGRPRAGRRARARIAACLDDARDDPGPIVAKPVVTTPEGIAAVLREADASPDCVGVIAWMHTFSPAKMWIAGLTDLRKPLVHLHTQYNRDLPWAEIDMDFMNLHQAAHGDREFAFIQTRLRRGRKTVVGHWQDPQVATRLGWWTRAAAGWHAAHRLKVARFGDNMREVAVTDGDKVEAQARLGFSVNGYGVADLVERVEAVPEAEVDRLVEAYADELRRRARPAPRAATGTRSSGRPPGSRAGCGRSSRTAASARSPTRSRTWARCRSCRASASSG